MYLNTQTDCVIHDPDLHRRITIQKKGSLSTVVWNPWLETASTMPDLGSEHWRSMVCFESANVFDNVVIVEPNQQHRLTVTYTVDRL